MVHVGQPQAGEVRRLRQLTVKLPLRTARPVLPARRFLRIAVVAVVAVPACGQAESAGEGVASTTTSISATTARLSTTSAPSTSAPATAPPPTEPPTTSSPPTTAPAPATTPPPPTTAPRDEPLQLSGDSVGVARFGEDAGRSLASLSEKLGSPSEDTGWEEFLPESEVEGTEYAAVAGQYYQSDDNLGPAWGYAVHRKVCWETLCVRLGGESQETAQLRGWEWTTEDYLPPTATVSNAELAGTGIQLGSTWEELQAAYPGVVAGRAEGGALAVDNRPWDGFFDGVSEWRLSGTSAQEQPNYAPPDAQVVRLSAGEGPQPGCC
jgi:hypothetical protein